MEIAQRLQGDAAAVLGKRPLETECNGDGPFTCEMRLGPDRAPKYRVELCGERYDARVWPPPTDPAPREIAHLGADCRAGADLAQRKAAVAGLSIDDPAACEKTWAADAAEECRAYVAAGSRLAATEILYVRPLLDGTTEVLVDDRDAKAAVLIEEQRGRYVIAGVD